MTVPSEPVPVPDVVTDIAVDGGGEYVKVSPPEWAPHLVAEAKRLAWATRIEYYRGLWNAGDISDR